MSDSRRVDVFFYGLFIDEQLLRAEGVVPHNGCRAIVRDQTVRVGRRAALVPSSGKHAHGMIFALTLADVARLYGAPSLQAYRPYAVLAELADGAVVPALCYNLPEPPTPDERNAEYAAKLRDAARRVGLPKEYVDSL